MISRQRWYRLGAAAVVLFAVCGLAQAAVPAVVIVKGGDMHGGRTVSTVNTPYTNGDGKVGFVASFDDSTRGIWYDTGFIFNSADAAPDTLVGGESNMGISNTGGFIYSPSVNGEDAVYTHGGTLLRGTDAIGALPGRFSTFNSRPQMTPNGTAYWMGGSSATSGGSSSNRHLLKATDPTDPNSITAVFSGGDIIDGKTVSTSASNFDFWISDNNANHIHFVTMVTGSTANDEHVYVNGSLLYQEGTAIGDGSGENWAGFDTPSINDSGNYLFSGDTSGPTATDNFLAYNGDLLIREGSTIDSITIASGAAVRAASLNNDDQAVFIWGWGTGGSAQEHLFYSSDASAMDSNSVRLLSIFEEIDIDMDGFGDYVVTDFNASGIIGPGLSYAEDTFVYVHVDMEPVGGGTSIQAVLRLGVPEPGSLALLAMGGALAMLRRRR